MEYSKDHLSQWVDFFAYNPASRHRRRILKELLAPLPFRSVLDVGCGDGSFLGDLKGEFNCEIYGLEPGDGAAKARELLDGYYRMDIAEKAPDKIFDLIVASEVLEHIQKDARALENIRSICGRYLLLTVPSGPLRATDRYMGHVRHYTLETLDRLAEGSGFRVLRSFAWGFPFHTLYKTLQDVVPGAMINNFGLGGYDWRQKAVCHFLYGLFFLNLRSRGQQLFLLGEKR